MPIAETNHLGVALLSILVFLPIVGAALIALLPREMPGIRGLALVVALIELALSVVMLTSFRAEPGFQHVERAAWIPALGLEYHLGVDGASVLMVFLTAFLTAIALLASWPAMEGNPRPWGVLLLLLEGGVIGAFVALDAILFFVFWEAMLIPMYLLITTLGGPRRVYAAVKFFVYTAVGSLVMLLGILSLYYLSGQQTFDLVRLTQTAVPVGAQLWLFLAFALAFAIKVPIFPLHTWLPDAYSQTPLTALVLGTMLVKVGAYGFIRFCLPLFPEAVAANAPIFATLAVIGILYGGMLALAQGDLVRLLAYSSISHLGFIALGIFALNQPGLSGATIQMLNHGISTGGLFVVVAMLARRVGTTEIENLGGLARRWPVLAAFLLVIMFSSLGLPGLNGFVGEFLILLGAFQRWTAWAVAASLGIILAAVYFLWMFRRTMHGPTREGATAAVTDTPPQGDLTAREIAVLVPIVVLIVWIGLFPSTWIGPLEPSLAAQLQRPAYADAGATLAGLAALLPK